MKENLFQKTGSALFWKAIQFAGVKIIFFLRLLVLARLLLPEDFGLLAIAVSSIGFLLSLTDLGMTQALVQSTDVDEIQYNTAWTVGVIRGLVVSGSVLIAAPLIAQLFAEPRAINIIRVISLQPLLDSAASIKVADLTRGLNFRALAILRLLAAVANTVVSIALADTFGVWALVAGALSGSLSYLMMSYLFAPHRPRLSFNRTAGWSLIQFGRWIFLTGLIAMAGSYVLRVVISRQLGASELGLYFLAAQLAFMPLEVASEMVGSVAFPLFARLQTDLQQVTRVFRAILTGVSALLFPACTLMIVVTPSLVQEVLGPRWEGTVSVIRLLALVSMLGIFGEVAVPILNGVGQPYKVTVLEIVQSTLIIIFVWTLSGRYGLVGAALAWLPAITASQIFSFIFLRQILWEPFAKLGAPMLMITVSSGVGAAVALFVDRIVPGLPGLALAIILAVTIIGGMLWVSDRRLALGLREGLSKAFPQVALFMGYSPADF
jgi:lipopolysaccharide exporter